MPDHEENGHSQITDLDLSKSDLQALVIQKTTQFRTLRETIYFYIRDAIIKQKIRPGQRIHENDTAKQFNVSTTPVREAFLKLQAEGYINTDAHRGATVRPISFSELTEIYQVMSVLDAFASVLALTKMDQSSIKELRRLTEMMENFYKKEMVDEYLESNARIHSFIWQVANNKCLRESIQNIQNQMLRYHKERLSFYSKPGILRKSMGSHKKILKAFMTSDSKNMERIVRSHWNISQIIPPPFP